MSLGEVIQKTVKEVQSRHGSGGSLDSPYQLGPIHPLLAPAIERVLISIFFGDKDKDWFDAGRRYHKSNAICEQLIRVSRTSKQDWLNPEQVYPMFFDISQLSYSAPVPEELRKEGIEAALRINVPNASFVSRFPLTTVKARDAKEAARTIAGYLAQAQAEGWNVGASRVLVENWRNEYDLTKAQEKTVFRFDMRPTLISSSRLQLAALTSVAGTTKLEEVIRNFDRFQSWSEAFAEAGLTFVDTSAKKDQPVKQPMPKERAVPDIFCDNNKQIIWNKEALERFACVNAKLVGRSSTLELDAADLLVLLTLAKSIRWEGANHLFQKVPTGFTLTLQNGQNVNDSDASELSVVLAEAIRNAQREAFEVPKTAESLARFAATSGFTIQYDQGCAAPNLGKVPEQFVARLAGGDSPVAGPPGGWARYRSYVRPFDLRRRIQMLNGFYGSAGRLTIVLVLKGPDYARAIAYESVDVSPDTMGFITPSKQLYLNADHVHTTNHLGYAYLCYPTVTTLHGPTFEDALCYGFYRLVCMFIGKDEFPTEDDVIQHVRDLKKMEREAMLKSPADRRRQLGHQHIKVSLQFMREFSERTPLEAVVARAQKKLRWRFVD
jgi:hypothetical protein